MSDALAPKWLVLVHQLPSRASNLRVYVWRRLQRVGAVALRSALYVLPNTPEAREDFNWIRTEIVGRGGQVNLLAAQAVDGYTDDELKASFRSVSEADYELLIRRAAVLRKRLTSRKQRLARTTVQREIGKVRNRLHAVRARDFFGTPRAAAAQEALDQLERLMKPAPVGDSAERLDPRQLRRRVWVTRPHPGIDRMASAWLIRRFVASDAAFTFSPTPGRGQIPFDMPDVEFGHHGQDCTFETLLRRFAITDAAAIRVGQLVHDLDLKDSRYGAEEGPTIGRLVEGIRRSAPSDHDMLEVGVTMVEALYRSFAVDVPTPTATRRSPRRPSSRKTPRR